MTRIFCHIKAYTYGSAAEWPKRVSQQHIVTVNRVILYSLYYGAILFFWGGGMLRRTVVNLTGNESRCAVYILRTSSIFTARRYASAVLAVVVCLSVCLSVTSRYCIKTATDRITHVCPSQAGIVSKRLQIGSRKQRHTIAQGL